MKLVKCKKCNGTGEVDCCGGHMCPGFKKCFECNGKGKQLSKRDKALKRAAEKLGEYR